MTIFACPLSGPEFYNLNQWKRQMNKSELVDAVSSAADLSKSDAARAVDGVIGAITQALKSGDQVTVVGFGTFLVRQREARAGRNPRTGETIQIKASKVPAFKAGKALKDAVN
jgi:DNA-binding protein HU-beta